MSSIGEEIFWKNANLALHDMGMPWLDPAHGAAVEILRWCLLVRSRPTDHRQRFLETDAPALLAYLEKLASRGEAQGWRALEERVRLHLQVLRENDMRSCPRPWLAAIWHTLPELAALGQIVLDHAAEKQAPAPGVTPVVTDASTGAGGDGDKGSAGKAGSAAGSQPRPSSRLALPAIPVVPTAAEEKVLDLRDNPENSNTSNEVTPDGPALQERGITVPRPPGAKP